jgi:phosphate transport system permease protein
VLVPLLSQHVFTHLIGHFSNVPILSFVFNGVPVGTTLLTAGVVLAVMIFPLITAMMRDVLGTIPALVIEASFGVGLSRLQVVRRIYIRYARAGLLGSIVLGMGRALGETMAVTFVIGNAHGMPQGLMVPGTTISATIANEFTEAMGKLYISSLVQLGLILFIIAFICLLISRRILKHSLTRGGSV